jgi:hypothetical protein
VVEIATTQVTTIEIIENVATLVLNSGQASQGSRSEADESRFVDRGRNKRVQVGRPDMRLEGADGRRQNVHRAANG